MGKGKIGAGGYRSFGYLTPGEDYAPRELVEDADLFPAHPVPLAPDEEERAERLAAELVLISLHEHLGSFPKRIEETPEYVREGRVFTPFEALSTVDSLLLVAGSALAHDILGTLRPQPPNGAGSPPPAGASCWWARRRWS